MTLAKSLRQLNRVLRPPDPRLSRHAADAVYARRGRLPYYIMAPQYDTRSAGAQVLYVLCHALNAIGEEAYVSLDRPPDPPSLASAAGLNAPLLTDERRHEHHRLGRTPVAVYPETYNVPASDAVRVLYVLNYLGVLGPATMPDCEMVIGYSRNILRRTPDCSLALHIPTVDFGYWTPGEPQRRKGACVYAGKFVDHHLQQLPADVADARQIHRWGAAAQSRDEVRDILRASTHLYVFENTAIALEAVLCGCPVVYRLNPFFDELISSHETGLAGFTAQDDPAAIHRAARAAPRLRARYADAPLTFGHRLLTFVRRTQRLARRRTYDRIVPAHRD